MKITDVLAETEKILLECKQKAIEQIENNAIQNPAIKPLGNRCFVIKASDLSKDLVLSPKYYDFSWQFDNLIKKLRKQSLETFKNTLQRLVDTGKLDGERYHPDVIAVIKDLI